MVTGQVSPSLDSGPDYLDVQNKRLQAGALTAALAEEPYQVRDLPEMRAMLVGIGRALVKSGVPADAPVLARLPLTTIV